MQWAETVLASLKEHRIRLVTYVPDNILVPLIDGIHADPASRGVTATREEEAIGITCGADMAGMRAAVLMQSSGFGNTLNALASLAVPYQLPLLLFISERGAIGEYNSVQMPIVRAMRPALNALGIPHVTLARADELEFLTTRMVAQCFATHTPTALFLSPLLTGGKIDKPGEGQPSGEERQAGTPAATGQSVAADERTSHGRPSTAMSRLMLTRRLTALLTHEEAVIAGIGNTNFDLFAAGHRPQNFYMLGSMGLAPSIALGSAIAQPERRVFALEGDGSLLMNLGCLATIAAVAPPNLTVIIWDNGAYQITGNQPTATAATTDIVGIARAAGIARSDWAVDEEDFARLVTRALATDGPHLIAARVDRTPGAARPERDPVLLRDRYVRGIGATL